MADTNDQVLTPMTSFPVPMVTPIGTGQVVLPSMDRSAAGVDGATLPESVSPSPQNDTITVRHLRYPFLVDGHEAGLAGSPSCTGLPGASASVPVAIPSDRPASSTRASPGASIVLLHRSMLSLIAAFRLFRPLVRSIADHLVFNSPTFIIRTHISNNALSRTPHLLSRVPNTLAIMDNIGENGLII